MKFAKPYTAPVNQLLTLGSPHDIEDWSRYLELGITEADIPELARMAIDRRLFNSGGDDFFGLVHAWRTLGELQTDQAIAPLIKAMTQWGTNKTWMDWATEEIPDAFGRLGARALPALAEVMANTGFEAYARQDAVNSVNKIVAGDPTSREAALNILIAQLQKFTKNDPNLNAHLVTTLAADLKAVEAADLIEQAFRAGRVNEDFMGDWDDVQVDLGLKQKSEIEPRPRRNVITNPWRYTPPDPIGFATLKNQPPKKSPKAKRQSKK